MIGILIVFIAICIAVYWQSLEDRIREQAFKNYKRKLQAKHGIRRREIIFVEEEAEEYIGEEHAGLIANGTEEEKEALYWS